MSLRSRDGDASVAAPVQTKRLALLVYLAMAPRRRLRRRDPILAMLWPDSDTEHARGALNQAVRYLRRTLGPDAVLTQGEEELGLDRELIGCDVIEFTSRLDAGNARSALELYRGPFLDGFFVEDAAAEWEEWVSRERAELRARAADAAAGCVAAAERGGDLVASLGWARRCVAIAPDDERAHSRLMRVMDAGGDRLGALAAYEALKRRLREEFGASPSAETESLIARIRAGSAS